MINSNKLNDEDFGLLIKLYNSGKFNIAEKKILNLFKEYPNELILHVMLGAVYASQKKFNKAISSYNKAIKINPNYAETYNNIGNVFQQKNEIKSAIINYKKAIEIKNDYAEPYYNFAILLNMQNNFNDAIINYKKAISLRSNYFEAHFNLGNTLVTLNNLEEAIINYKYAIKINPNYVECHNNLGNALKEIGKINESIKSYSKALLIKPNYFEAHNNLGNALQEMGEFNKAIKSFNKAISIEPNYVSAHNNLGIVFQKTGKIKEASKCYYRAIDINKNHYQAYSNLAILKQETDELDEAIKYYKKAYYLNPQLGDALINYWHLRQFCCDWSDQKFMQQQVIKFIKNYDKKKNIKNFKIFPLLSIIDNPALHFVAANAYSKNKEISKKIYLKNNKLDSNKKIKVGYLSNDFKDHPCSYLTAGVFENHEKNKFEVYCISTCMDDKSKIRERIKNACDFFIDVSKKSDLEIAKLIESLSINILIDINGHTKGSRLEIFSHLNNIPKIGFLGYPGTVGGNINQYIIADSIVIPPKEKKFFSEKVVYMPNTYQCTDNNAEISKKNITRSDCRLPKHGFVFCCFNQTYKITPQIYDIWMKLLKKIDGSVLWLMSSNKWAENNLVRKAKEKDISNDRIIFAKRLPHEKHLARIKNADLFLDTIPYNAHTTASDALWVEVPVLTLSGKSFASRVGSSILTAAGLTELIAPNIKKYESIALNLAKSPNKLSSLKQKLRKNFSTKPLFNTKLYTKNLENKYEKIWKQHKKTW